MKNSNLVSILKAFSKKELRKLYKFIQSPYFNENQKVLALFEYLMDFAPNYNATVGLDRKVIFRHIFPNKDYQKDSGLPLRRLISLLTRLIEQFIELEYLEGFEGAAQKACLSTQSLVFYEKHNLEKQYTKLVHQAKHKIAEQYPFKSMEYHAMQYQLNLIEYDFYSGKDWSKSATFLVNGLGHLNRHHLLAQLQIYCLLMSLERVVHLNNNIKQDAQHLLQQMRQSKECRFPLVQIYYHALRILSDSEHHDSFEILKALLQIHEDKLPDFELRQLYVYAKNFCIANKKKGKVSYNKDLFELFQLELTKGIIYSNGKLLPSYFQVIVRTALEEQAFDWLSTFLNQHEHRILGNDPKQVFRFSLADFALARKDFDQASQLLISHNFTDPNLKFQVRKLLVKLYYETNQDDSLKNALTALKAYIYRNKERPKCQLERNKNFANFLNRLMNTMPGDVKRKAQLRKSLAEKKNIAERKWLREMVEVL